MSAPTGQRSMTLPVNRPSYWSPVNVPISLARAAVLHDQRPVLGDVLAEAHAAEAEMQRSRSSAISDDRSSGFGKWRLGSTKRVRPGPKRNVAVLERALAALVADRAVERVVLEQELQHAVLAVDRHSELVRTTMSGWTGVLQAVWRPRMPSTSTRHMRQAPMGAPRRGS